MSEPKDDSSESQLLEQKIMNYFLAQPNAADTAEGICNWWLTGQGVHCSPASVKIALESLVVKSLVTKTINQAGDPIYAKKFTKD